MKEIVEGETMMLDEESAMRKDPNRELSAANAVESIITRITIILNFIPLSYETESCILLIGVFSTIKNVLQKAGCR